MPVVQGTDGDFTDLTVPGGGPYASITGSPTRVTNPAAPGWPAALEINANNEWLSYAFASSPTLGWHAFYFRIDTEPAGDVDVAHITAAGIGDARLSYSPTTHKLYHFMPGSSTDASPVLSLATWYWVEQIYDVSTAVGAIYTMINGVPLVPMTAAVTPGSVGNTEHGQGGADSSFIYYLGGIRWGAAAHVSDWLGVPDPNVILDFSRLSKQLMLDRP